ncbi:hypothetical protein D3C73_1500450 [compost metagenome]
MREALSVTPGIDFYTPGFPGIQPNDLYMTIPRNQGEVISHIVEEIDPEATLFMTPVHGSSDD